MTLNLNHFSHSSDSLEIVHENHRSLVRKTFRSDLKRARCNVEKQKSFRPIYTGTARLRAAEVLDFEIHNDVAELVMPYIEGITGNMFSIYATRNIAHTLSCSLSALLYSELNESYEMPISKSLFHEKLASVSIKTHDLSLRALVDSCQDIIETLPAEINFPIGPCHGDLTLSNLILDPVSGITLIDFLHTFLESPLQDVAKLKQDFVYGWSFRKDSTMLRVKAEILCRHHFPEAILQIEKAYPIQVYLLTLLSLARIAPYVKDETTQKWLHCCLTNCLDGYGQALSL